MLNFNHILCVIDRDFDPDSAAFRRALSLAQGQQADLTLLLVLPDLSQLISVDAEQRRELVKQQCQQHIEQQLQRVDDASQVAVKVAIGKRYVQTIQAVLAYGYDLVIKVAQSPSWLDRWLGSDDMHLLRKCPCPVWLLRPDDKDDYQNIVAAVDLSAHEDEARDLNDDIASLASSVCLSDFAALHIVSVYDAPEAGFVSMWADDPERAQQRLLDQAYQQHEVSMQGLTTRLRERLGSDTYQYLQPSTHLRRGIASQQLVEETQAQKADLLVMGTVARSGVPGVIIGNTAETVLSTVNCSVLAIKPRGFISPVTL
ncbi:universal stress protein [Bacterioplanes sanyensis]|uniref:universal stress protein n=1 Tax=Bacterioplanes sanyensis TaxID=1249553 RepID=UPI0016783662|nr:universal stress protein [Bacterioplanes sanyensis]GGY32039.1 universal stress protein [Bacterioplanes sanyensis]